jgi:hypothetical protein
VVIASLLPPFTVCFILHSIPGSIDHDYSLTFFEKEELINVSMDLHTDVLPPFLKISVEKKTFIFAFWQPFRCPDKVKYVVKTFAV